MTWYNFPFGKKVGVFGVTWITHGENIFGAVGMSLDVC